MVSGSWNDHWIFWFGPYLGSTGAALMYGYVFADLEAEAQEAAKGALGGIAPVPLVDADAASPRSAAPAGVVYNPAYGAGAAPAATVPAPAVAAATFTGKSGNAAFAAPEASAAYVASTNDGGQEWR